MLPSEYFDRNIKIGSSNTRRRELARRYEIGVGNIMWGNDFPHPEGTWPYTKRILGEAFHDIPVDETEQILGLNAAEFYGFDVDALQPIADEIGPTAEDLGQTDPAGVRQVGRPACRRSPLDHRARGGAGRAVTCTLAGQCSGRSRSSPAPGRASGAGSRSRSPSRRRRRDPRAQRRHRARAPSARSRNSTATRLRSQWSVTCASAPTARRSVAAAVETLRWRRHPGEQRAAGADRTARRLHRRRHVHRVGIGRARRVPSHAAVPPAHD